MPIRKRSAPLVIRKPPKAKAMPTRYGLAAPTAAKTKASPVRSALHRWCDEHGDGREFTHFIRLVANCADDGIILRLEELINLARQDC
jgi:hypothetical protein